MVPDRMGGTRFSPRLAFVPSLVSFRIGKQKKLSKNDSSTQLEKTSSSKGYKMTMFVRPKDPYDESWNGPRSGTDGVCEVFGADDVSCFVYLNALSYPPADVWVTPRIGLRYRMVRFTT